MHLQWQSVGCAQEGFKWHISLHLICCELQSASFPLVVRLQHYVSILSGVL